MDVQASGVVMANGQEKSIEAHKLTVHEKCYVLPARPAAQRYCDLITFDLPYVTFHYNQKVLLYPTPSQGLNSMVESLKKGLSEALAYFYPLAGRLCMEDGILKVDCNDAGVDFVQASWKSVSLADLEGPESSPMLKEIVAFDDTINLEGFFLPMVAVQVTELSDGVALGISINHLIVDGYSTWHFMSSWAELCRGSKTISLHPSHDRAPIRDTKVKLNITPPTEPKRDFGKNGSTHIDKPLLRAKIFHFSKEMMDKIKSMANKNKEGKPFSTFQSLGAHLWRAVTRARKLAPEEITVFTLFIDCRTRLDPPVSKNYFGNVIQGIYGATAVGYLLSNDLPYAANLLQEVIDSHGHKAITDMNEAWEKNPKLYSFNDAGMNCITVGSSPRFQVYENDFGWGKPVQVRGGGNNKFDGMVYLYPGRDGGGSVDVDIALLPSTMDALESDAEFLSAN